MENMCKKIFKLDNLIFIVLAVALILRVVAMIQLQPDYNINSDDMAFIESGEIFVTSGKITMHYVESAKNMPGMTFLVAIFIKIFGDLTNSFWIAIKIFWIFMGVASIYGIYKIIRLYANPIVSSILCLTFCLPDFLWLDNLILTETPYMLCNVWLIYSSLMLASTKKKRYFIAILCLYILGLMIRPTLALFPLILFAYLIVKKYDIKVLIKQAIIALGVLLVILIPWWVRNYKLFNEFIPLTYGTGDPLLLGTYQGSGYPSDEDLDYNEYLFKEDEKIKNELGADKEYTSKKQWAIFKDEENMAKFRMKKWWQTSKKSFIKSYFILKPFGVVSDVFYWKEVFNVNYKVLLILRRIGLAIFVLCFIASFIFRNRIREVLFLCGIYLYYIVLYSYTFSFSRYGQVLIFIRPIIIGWMIYEIYKTIKEKERI